MSRPSQAAAAAAPAAAVPSLSSGSKRAATSSNDGQKSNKKQRHDAAGSAAASAAVGSTTAAGSPSSAIPSASRSESDPLTCFVCLHEYESDEPAAASGPLSRMPRVLRCGHDCCSACVANFAIKHNGTVTCHCTGVSNLEVPAGKAAAGLTPADWASQLPVNRRTIDMIREQARGHLQMSDSTCRIPDCEAVVSHYCVECARDFCTAHEASRHVWLSKHKRMPLAQKATFLADQEEAEFASLKARLEQQVQRQLAVLAEGDRADTEAVASFELQIQHLQARIADIRRTGKVRSDLASAVRAGLSDVRAATSVLDLSQSPKLSAIAELLKTDGEGAALPAAVAPAAAVAGAAPTAVAVAAPVRPPAWVAASAAAPTVVASAAVAALPPLDLLALRSSILTRELVEHHALDDNTRHLFKGIPMSNARLLYRGSRDRFMPADVWRHCAVKANTLTLVKVAGSGNVIAAYTPVTWSSTKMRHIADPSGRTCLISLVNTHGRPCRLKLKASEHAYAVYMHPRYGPAFGGGFDLVIMHNEKAANTSNGCICKPSSFELDHTAERDAGLPPLPFRNDKLLLSGVDNSPKEMYADFSASEVECYQL